MKAAAQSVPNGAVEKRIEANGRRDHNSASIINVVLTPRLSPQLSKRFHGTAIWHHWAFSITINSVLISGFLAAENRLRHQTGSKPSAPALTLDSSSLRDGYDTNAISYSHLYPDTEGIASASSLAVHALTKDGTVLRIWGMTYCSPNVRQGFSRLLCPTSPELDANS